MRTSSGRSVPSVPATPAIAGPRRVTQTFVYNRNVICNTQSPIFKVLGSVAPTAAAPASEVEAVVRSPTNMAAAKIAAVDFNKMTSKGRHSTGLLAAVCWGRSASQSTASNASAVLIGRRVYLI